MARNWENVRREAAEAGLIDEQRVENAKRELMTNATRAGTLTEFLRARIDEDEVVAKDVPGGPWDATADAQVVAISWSPIDGGEVADCFHMDPAGDGIAVHIARHDPTRVLAECEAKRRIVDIYSEGYWADAGNVADLAYEDGNPNSAATAGNMLRALATVYSDHPDYREEWRP